MITFTFLNKKEKELWLPRLFDLLYANMQVICPSENTFDQEKAQWLGDVSPALEKDPRQIILCLNGEKLVGYVQYYTRQNLLMIEEIQVEKSYQRSTVFYGVCKYLARWLPEEITVIEAYAEKRNYHSRSIMGKLGMTKIDEDGPFVHFQGNLQNIKERFK